MKTTLCVLLAAVLPASLPIYAADPPPAQADKPAVPQAAASAEKPAPARLANDAKNPNSGTLVNGSANGELRMNFDHASLETVLKYLSEAAGFIISVKPGTSIRGTVTIISSQPVTKDEAVDLLDTELVQNGLAAIRVGRKITIVNRDEAKTQHIPVVKEADPDKIPLSDRIMTYIIPARFVEAAQLIKDIQPLVSMQTTMTANEAGNSVIITDTQANIHRVAEVIHDLDSGAEDFTEVRVFPLNNSDPNDIADLLTSLFPDDTKTGTTQSPFQGGGRFGRFFGGGGPFGGGNQAASTSANSQSQRIKKRNRVIAVADQRTASVVVSASRDLIDEIDEVIKRIDENPKGKMMVSVMKTPNADPEVIKQLLQEVFPNQSRNTGRTGSTSSTSALSARQASQTQ